MLDSRRVKRERVRRGLLLAAIVGAVAGCTDRRAENPDRRVAVIPSDASPDSPHAKPAPAVPVTPSPTPSRAVIVRKTFTDPPLPPELRDDGGLVPLPPRPPASAMATRMRPTFESAGTGAMGEQR